MSPEEPGKLIFIDSWREGKAYKGKGWTAYNGIGLRVSWYADEPPPGSRGLGDGTLYVYSAANADFQEIARSTIRRKGGFYYWGDTIRGTGLMIALILPKNHTIINPVPMLREAKELEGLDRMAVYWMFEREEQKHVEARWNIQPTSDLELAVDTVNRMILEAPEEPFYGGGPEIVEEPIKETKQALKKILVQNFDKNGLIELCFDLDVDYEEIKGDTKTAKVIGLILYLNHEKRLHELTEIGPQIKPKIKWPIIKPPPNPRNLS